MRPAPIALLTDFGLEDPYVGQMRAVLGRSMPDTPLMDICHGVPPHAVMSGALFLAASRPCFPDHTLFLCVVDSGVGSSRPIHCAIQQGGARHILLGPGNGLLSLAAEDMAKEASVRWWSLRPPAASTPAPLPARTISHTFHGRDIFPLLAAALRQGADPAALGTALPGSPSLPEWTNPCPIKDGFELTVLHVDRFGNCILNLSAGTPVSAAGCALRRAAAADLPLRLATHYAELAPGDVGLLRSSQGYWEMACREQSAAALLHIQAGDRCELLCRTEAGR